ncbi:sterol desaturase family [Talaromyces proteolyticus]|uniref:Sterol desaturase family n=1 Tax=Talaromyces proteolyticus TaxID=1131652 RepID=A0AAD4KSG8_9EURO|nr:sterol desaturase family [Talaromyces proteolyticus]KAH8697362.1 sterol desaturase family [Talaromyces proteolyticus]
MYFIPFTTSLNFLFFWMTWTTLVLSHSPLRVELFGTLAIRLVFYLVPSLFFFLFDALLPAASMSIKAQGNIGLPSGHKRKRLSRTEAKIVAWSLFNILLSIAAQGAIEFTLTKTLRFRSAIRVAVRLPYPWGITIDIVRGFIVREILNYSLHRFVLHNRNLPVARLHDSWYHGLRAPWPLTAHYDHPICYLIWKFLPLYIPAALFRFHMTTYMIFLALVSLEETFTHSGYSALPMGILLGGMARRTELHVISGGDGNYGAWGILDWVGGSTVGGSDSIEDDVREEIAALDIDEKIRKAVEDAKRHIGDSVTKEANKGKTRRRVNNNA